MHFLESDQLVWSQSDEISNLKPNTVMLQRDSQKVKKYWNFVLNVGKKEEKSDDESFAFVS